MKAHLSNATTEEAQKSLKNRIFSRLTDDGTSCSVGIDERNEANFLTGLSRWCHHRHRFHRRRHSFAVFFDYSICKRLADL